MNNQIPFQFKVLRYIHDSFTGEFLNIGLAMLASDQSYFKISLLQKYSRITGTFPTASGEHYYKYIGNLQKKFDSVIDVFNSKQINFSEHLPTTLDGILALVLPPDDSAIQFGPTQFGMDTDLDTVFGDLYYRLVETHISSEARLSRNEQEVWHMYSAPLRRQKVISSLRPTIIKTHTDDIELDHAWKNGHWKALQPISFDLLNSASIKNKARLWLGTSMLLSESTEISKIYYLLGRPRRDDRALKIAYDRAKDTLAFQDMNKIEIIEEDAIEDFGQEIADQIRADIEHQQNID